MLQTLSTVYETNESLRENLTALLPVQTREGGRHAAWVRSLVRSHLDEFKDLIIDY